MPKPEVSTQRDFLICALEWFRKFLLGISPSLSMSMQGTVYPKREEKATISTYEEYRDVLVKKKALIRAIEAQVKELQTTNKRLDKLQKKLTI